VTTEHLWLSIGLLGQAMFSARFLVQWIASERRRQSVVPRAFWFFSIGGGLTMLAYAIYRRDPIFILGQSAGLVVYARNLWLIYSGARAGP
jgi:lipid-A-disaccharide synthase-like uncharacterized protein